MSEAPTPLEGDHLERNHAGASPSAVSSHGEPQDIPAKAGERRQFRTGFLPRLIQGLGITASP